MNDSNDWTELSFKFLMDKYGRLFLTKRETAIELCMSLSNLNIRISSGIGLPPYKRLGTSRNSRILFNIYDIAIYLNSEKIETM